MTQSKPLRHGIFFLPGEQACAATLSVDLGGLTSRTGILRKLGQALTLPGWYGNNFDALFDCLSDPQWQHERPVVLRLFGLGPFQKQQAAACATLMEVLAGAADARTADGAALAVVVDISSPDAAAWPAP